MSYRRKKVLWVAGSTGVLAICAFARLRPMNAFPALPAATAYCTVQNEADLPDISGLYFQLTRMTCDTLAKDISVSLVVSRNRTDTSDVIFKYWPNERSPIPTLALAGNHLHIVAPSVASIYYKAQQWQGLTIDYDIGSVVYPTARPRGRNDEVT